jgi:hypothetical protein
MTSEACVEDVRVEIREKPGPGAPEDSDMELLRKKAKGLQAGYIYLASRIYNHECMDWRYFEEWQGICI